MKLTIPLTRTRTISRKILPAVLLVLLTPLTATAQDIKLAGKQTTRLDAIQQVERQTDYRFVYNRQGFDDNRTVDFGATEIGLTPLLDKMTEGSGFRYLIDDRQIVLFAAGRTATATVRTLTGQVLDSDGATPVEGASVEFVNIPGRRATTSADGGFRIQRIAPGSHLVKITPADGSPVRYREVAIAEGSDTDVILVLSEIVIPSSAAQTAQAAEATQSTAYFRLAPQAPEQVSWNGPKSQYSIVPSDGINDPYLPKVAIKTNLLYLATTTLNLAAEFGLARKWTLDVVVGLNPWDLNGDKGGIRHGLVQPEVRYWFCNRFERHFIGLHGIYGVYQIQNIDLSPFGNDLTGKRYDGWGVGGGISYGYHLPMGKRWGWEFTVGVGYIYLDYDKYNCGECDNLIGNRNKHYFGPTKAGISLIYMIK